MSMFGAGTVYSDSNSFSVHDTARRERVRPASVAADWRPRVRPADLSKIENFSTSISISESHHRSESVDVKHNKRGEAAAKAALRWEESETEFSEREERISERNNTPHSYGAITQASAGAGQGGDEREGLISSGKRKQSAAVAGKAFEKVASRNKRAQHATTYVEQWIINDMLHTHIIYERLAIITVCFQCKEISIP